jgi:1-acyl-sn-glycerol-3-phosphate acyltransferase
MRLAVTGDGKVGAGETARIPLPAGLVVSNHVSWLDIYVINALAPAAFVAKDDVRDWPLIGWLCTHTETIFLARGSRAAAQQTRETIVGELCAGTHVAVFPEGTTTGGERVLPFHGALFQSAIDAGVPVLPLALRYVAADGRPSRAPAYDGDITLLQSMRAIARSGELTAQLRVLAPLASEAADRRHLAARSQRAIAFHLGLAADAVDDAIASPTVSPTGRRASETPGDLPDARPSDCHPTDSPNPAPAAYPSA